MQPPRSRPLAFSLAVAAAALFAGIAANAPAQTSTADPKTKPKLQPRFDPKSFQVAAPPGRDECRPGDPKDADGDGHDAVVCGGDDCDDGNPRRFPGNVEVCDAQGLDEDCDATTFGERDADRDGFFDARCCNRDASGRSHCGTDCDDARASVNPIASEVCNGFDDNCDGAVDEGVRLVAFEDRDRDLFGSSRRVEICPHQLRPGLVVNDYDCDDADPRRNPWAGNCP